MPSHDFDFLRFDTVHNAAEWSRANHQTPCDFDVAVYRRICSIVLHVDFGWPSNGWDFFIEIFSQKCESIEIVLSGIDERIIWS